MANTYTPDYEIGDIVKVSEENDNEGYTKFRNRPLLITSRITSSDEHMAYDDSMEGSGLYDFVDEETGEDVPFSLYDYELESYEKGGKVVKVSDIKKRFEKFTDEELQLFNGENEETLKDWTREDGIYGAVVIEINELESDEDDYVVVDDINYYAKGGEIDIEDLAKQSDKAKENAKYYNESFVVYSENGRAKHIAKETWDELNSEARKGRVLVETHLSSYDKSRSNPTYAEGGEVDRHTNKQGFTSKGGKIIVYYWIDEDASELGESESFEIEKEATLEAEKVFNDGDYPYIEIIAPSGDLIKSFGSTYAEGGEVDADVKVFSIEEMRNSKTIKKQTT